MPCPSRISSEFTSDRGRRTITVTRKIEELIESNKSSRVSTGQRSVSRIAPSIYDSRRIHRYEFNDCDLVNRTVRYRRRASGWPAGSCSVISTSTNYSAPLMGHAPTLHPMPGTIRPETGLIKGNRSGSIDKIRPGHNGDLSFHSVLPVYYFSAGAMGTCRVIGSL